MPAGAAVISTNEHPNQTETIRAFTQRCRPGDVEPGCDSFLDNTVEQTQGCHIKQYQSQVHGNLRQGPGQTFPIETYPASPDNQPGWVPADNAMRERDTRPAKPARSRAAAWLQAPFFTAELARPGFRCFAQYCPAQFLVSARHSTPLPAVVPIHFRGQSCGNQVRQKARYSMARPYH